ncbi:MAG: DMT family transporter [Planctomycetaceae bacterium]|nr:DMT family transporter [Planctomycetaceae bacterium]
MIFLAVLLRIIVNPLSYVFQKQICFNGQSPLFANFLTYLALSCAVVPFVWNITWTAFPPAFWGYCVLVGVFGAVGNGFLVKAVRSGELSVLGPINAYKSVVGMIFAIVLLREIPSLSGVCGIGLIVAGSYFVLDSGTHSERLSWKVLTRPDLRYRFAAMVIAAAEAVFTKKVILYSDPQIATIIWCWGGAIFSFLFLPIQGYRENSVWSSEWKKAGSNVLRYIGLVCSVGLMQLTTNYVFAKIPVGYAFALFQLSVVFSVFYGWFFFNESQIFRKLSASAVMVLGSILIIFG